MSTATQHWEHTATNVQPSQAINKQRQLTRNNSTVTRNQTKQETDVTHVDCFPNGSYTTTNCHQKKQLPESGDQFDPGRPRWIDGFNLHEKFTIHPKLHEANDNSCHPKPLGQNSNRKKTKECGRNILKSPTPYLLHPYRMIFPTVPIQQTSFVLGQHHCQHFSLASRARRGKFWAKLLTDPARRDGECPSTSHNNGVILSASSPPRIEHCFLTEIISSRHPTQHTHSCLTTRTSLSTSSICIMPIVHHQRCKRFLEPQRGAHRKSWNTFFWPKLDDCQTEEAAIFSDTFALCARWSTRHPQCKPLVVEDVHEITNDVDATLL